MHMAWKRAQTENSAFTGTHVNINSTYINVNYAGHWSDFPSSADQNWGSLMKCPHFVINMRAFTNLSNISFLHWYLSRLTVSHMSNSSFMFWMRKKRKRKEEKTLQMIILKKEKKKKKTLLCRWQSAGTACLENLWILFPRRSLEAAWMWFGAPCSGCPYLSGGWTR